MNIAKKYIAVFLLLAFSLGFFSNSLYRKYSAPMPPFPPGQGPLMKERMRLEFERFFHLTPEQKQQAKAVFENADARIQEIRREEFPKLEAIRLDTQKNIREILRPEQRERFDKLHAAREARRKDMPKGPGRFPPGGPRPFPPPGPRP